jgi:hypothetical protein
MGSKRKSFGTAEVLEVAAATAYFVSLTLLLVLWQPGSPGWGFLIHALTLFCLGASLFSFSISGYKSRRPFSLPEILLFMVFLYEIINAILSRVPYASLEMLPFFLDGLILYYVGATLFARRHEGFILMTLLFLLGIGILLIFTEYGNLWKNPMNQFSVYRGKKMLTAALFEHPLWGCGSGALPLLSARYLPLGDRYPPCINPVFGRFLAEQGFIGASVWIIALAGMISSLFRKQGEKSSGGKLRTICFWIAVTLCGVFLSGGFMSAPLSLPLILYGFLPLSGMAFILRQGSGEPVSRGENQFQRHKVASALAILVPIAFIFILETTPYIAASLMRLGKTLELGTKGYGRRIGAARLLTPYNPEIHLMQAKHIRAQESGDPKGAILSIEMAYLRALQENPYNERYYLEYAHFLDLVRDYSGMVSTLEQGAGYCPGSVEIKMLLFRGYMNTGYRREALDTLSSLRGYYPLDYAAHERLAKYYAEAGAQAASVEEKILARQINPIFKQEK